jgi:monoamine oxidase
MAADRENRKVLVLGAGMSGLAAARELVQRGYEVLVLEGRSRPGGRTVSVEMDGAMVDLGAGFIHGEPRMSAAVLSKSGGGCCRVHVTSSLPVAC